MSSNQGRIYQHCLEFVNSKYRFPVYTCALSPGPLRRMQFSNAYTLRWVYSVNMKKLTQK
jgi:hypothetical protein